MEWPSVLKWNQHPDFSGISIPIPWNIQYIHRNPLEAGIVDKMQDYQWSTHKPYLSEAKKWDWLYKDYILKLFSKFKPESVREYKKFVRDDTPEKISQIFKRPKLPSILGSKSFIDKIKFKFSKFKDNEEIPEAKVLVPEVDIIKKAVCKTYKVDEATLYKCRRGYFNEPKSVAIYLVKRLRNDTLKDVGICFEIEKYSTVSSIVERVKTEISSNQRFARKLEKLTNQILKSQKKI